MRRAAVGAAVRPCRLCCWLGRSQRLVPTPRVSCLWLIAKSPGSTSAAREEQPQWRRGWSRPPEA